MALNIEDLGRMVAERRGTQGVRATAKEIGISPATLSRIENQHVPDLETFAKICDWLGEDPSQFFGMKPTKTEQSTVAVHMRKRSTTSLDTAQALATMIVAAQEAIRNREDL